MQRGIVGVACEKPDRGSLVYEISFYRCTGAGGFADLCLFSWMHQCGDGQDMESGKYCGAAA